MSVLKVKNGTAWIDVSANGVGIPSGGTTGQFLRKNSSTDYSTEWATPPVTSVNGKTGAVVISSSDIFSDGMTVLSSDQYGTTLPNAGNEGRIFFLKVQ